MKFETKYKSFHYKKKCIWKCCLQSGGHFVKASMCVILAVPWANINSHEEVMDNDSSNLAIYTIQISSNNSTVCTTINSLDPGKFQINFR